MARPSTARGYWFGGTGNFEGVWAADQSTGAIKWLADCHGDTYDSTPINGAIYSVSHHHHCDNIASFPEQNPRKHKRGNAFTADVKGTVRANNQGGYANFAGYSAPSQINWFPDMPSGTFTGQAQAGFTIESNSDYVVDRWRVPVGQRHQAAGPGPVRRSVEGAQEAGQPDQQRR